MATSKAAFGELLVPVSLSQEQDFVPLALIIILVIICHSKRFSSAMLHTKVWKHSPLGNKARHDKI